MRKRVAALIGAICMIAIDQFLKFIIKENKITGGFINYFENANIQSLKTFIIITVVTFTLLIAVIIFINAKNEENESKSLTNIAIAMIFSGGISNMLDIATKKSVTDYLIINKTNLNFADFYTIIGWILLIIVAFAYFYEKKIKRVEK